MLLEQIGMELDLAERHLIVLKKVIEEGPIGILKLAEVTGMQNHKVRYSLRVLEQANLIKPSAQGAVPGDAVPKFLREFEEELERINEKISRIREIEASIPK
ncbi:hypothetical protein FTO70_02445 [Methanosarcina sp. KYL-1]|uniref:hypothetical protein n=1 Tax=Methanosarcina sp. KYL-1 TaxID=2602068 RepID=UPI002100F910|nr:hypothetical protein [Methanosarcina sp. KYL-1]MCQ1534569.1 hypothetical protein [Methanosarcina sp. KYL-1]